MASGPVTEVAILSIPKETTIADPSSPSGTTWSSLMSTIASQPGYQRLRWGRQIDSPSTVKLFIDWDSMDAHKVFMASEGYTPFMEEFGNIIAGPPTIYHAYFEPFPPDVATESPLTQCVTMYLPTDVPSSRKDFFERHVRTFSKMAKMHAKGYEGASGGWVEEELVYKGEKKIAYTVAVGWDDKKHYEAWRQTGAFEGAIGGMRDHSDGMDVSFCELNGTI